MNRRIREDRILKRARELAASGKFSDSHAVEAELRFQLGESPALDTLVILQTRAQLDLICMNARELRGDILVSQRMRAELCRILIDTRNLNCQGTAVHGKRNASPGTPGSNGLMRRRLNADQKRALKAAEIARFVKQYARKAQKNTEPNDRCYSREIEEIVRRMVPEMLDHLLRDDEA